MSIPGVSASYSCNPNCVQCCPQKVTISCCCCCNEEIDSDQDRHSEEIDPRDVQLFETMDIPDIPNFRLKKTINRTDKVAVESFNSMEIADDEKDESEVQVKLKERNVKNATNCSIL